MGSGCSSCHVSCVLNVARSVRNYEFSLGRGKITVGHIDGNALLSLSQYYIDVDQPAMAVKHLENENYGLLNLIQKQDPVASKPATVESAFRAALAGYMSMLAGADGAGNIEKAKAVMQQLNSVVGESPDGKKRLVSIYFTLARDLEEQLNAAETAEKKNVLAAGFETFLDEVGTAGTDFSIRYWAASTMQGLGTSFESNGTLTPKATAYFNKSVQLFQSVAEQGKNDIAWVNEDETTGKAYLAQIRMNMAQVMKRLGLYEEATKELAYILLEYLLKILRMILHPPLTQCKLEATLASIMQHENAASQIRIKQSFAYETKHAQILLLPQPSI